MNIEQLAKKVARLVETARKLKTDNERYAAERERFINERKEQERKIAELKKRIHALELAGGLVLSENGTAPARKKVAKILREIDALLALTTETVDVG
ncbi:MAG: hypothetical protein K2F53_03715 [Rikenellaceae bacterium]|nr:hypothetical protein [Rikenellaceae bacterium]MDE7355919.1 hypothetical protein [Rikenellaceae bacterium]